MTSRLPPVAPLRSDVLDVPDRSSAADAASCRAWRAASTSASRCRCIVAARLAARRCIHTAAWSACSASQAIPGRYRLMLGCGALGLDPDVMRRRADACEGPCALVAIARALVSIAPTAHGLAGHAHPMRPARLRGAARNPSLPGSQRLLLRSVAWSRLSAFRPRGRSRRGKRHRRQRGIASARLVTGTTSGDALSAAFLECGP